METITCKKCGSVDQYRTGNSGPHIRADCETCGAFIKFLAQNQNPVNYIGKYSGTPIAELSDAAWVAWVLSNIPIKPGMKIHYQNRLNQLTT